MAKNLKKEDIDFEIAFYNGLIKKKPDFAEAYVALGELYTSAGMYKEGLAVDEQLVLLKPADPIAHYNLSCSYSLLEYIDKALFSFKRAVECGYSDFEHVDGDDDLENLRRDQRFQKFYIQIKNKKPSADQE